MLGRISAVALAVCFTGMTMGDAAAQTNRIWDPGKNPDVGSVCPECYVDQVEIMVPNTQVPVVGPNPPCGNPESVNFSEILLKAFTGKIDPEAAGNLIEAAKLEAYKAVKPLIGGTLGNIIQANTARTPWAVCAPLVDRVPKSATIKGIRLGQWDKSAGPGGCPEPEGECSTGWGRFVSRTKEPVEDSATGERVIAAIYANGSHDRDRVARMWVLYTMPAGKKPIPLL
jgi:hypothetical protein